MTEHEVRQAIYGRELKPNSKLTLLGVLDIVKWGVWESKCSSKDVAKRMKMRESTVRRAFKDLIELNLISRVAQRRETVEGNAYHHRAVTRLNVKEVMRDTPLAHNEPPLAHNEPPLAHNEPPLAHSELTPLAHSELTPTLIMSYNTTGVTTEDNNRETTGANNRETTGANNRETQSSHSSEPDQESKAEEAEELFVDEGKYPQHVIDYARGTGHTLERAQQIMDNGRRKLELRRERDKSGKYNRPTTAYNPKPY